MLGIMYCTVTCNTAVVLFGELYLLLYNSLNHYRDQANGGAAIVTPETSYRSIIENHVLKDF